MNLNSSLHNSHLQGDSFYWQGGPIGVVLAHGYSATTAEIRLIAQKLHQQGYTVAGPLLPGHGTSPEAMNRCHWQDWTQAMEEAYQSMAAQCEHVFVGGESMGALLALYLADLHPEIAGILAYAPAVRISRQAVILSYLAAPFLPYVAKKNIDRINKHWQGYRVNPVPAVTQLHRLQRQVKRRIPTLHQPLLIVQGRLDVDIDLRGVELLYQEIASDVKSLYWMEESNHLVMLDREQEQVTALTLAFMEQVLEPQ